MVSDRPRPQQLPPNLIEHWYRGGPALARWRGLPHPGERSPEEWLGSTTGRYGDPCHGPSDLPGGHPLREAVTADPVGWLGRADGRPGDTGLLVKLLDAGQRLPVHVHPTRDFAARWLGEPYGKTEAWYVLQAQPGARVWLGWREPMTAEQVSDLVATQDVEAMLAALHEIPVDAGDGVLVPGGTPHAIGEGILLVEAQEPTDQSILLERVGTTATDAEVFLGLDRELALSCVGLEPTTAVRELVLRAGGGVSGSVLPVLADPFFRMERMGAGLVLRAGFAVAVVLAGAGVLREQDGVAHELRAGQVWVVPAAAGDWGVEGEVAVLGCRAGTSWPPG